MLAKTGGIPEVASIVNKQAKRQQITIFLHVGYCLSTQYLGDYKNHDLSITLTSRLC